MAAKKGSSSGSGFTEDWLPVRAIQNNMIITKDNYKVSGVKIAPRNIFILDPEQEIPGRGQHPQVHQGEPPR